MDGTLLVSDAVVARIWRGWADVHGLSIDRIVDAGRGRRTIDTIKEFCPPGLSPEVEAARLEELERNDTDGIVPMAGALRFLDALPPDRWAVVTSADRALAQARLNAAGIAVPRVLITAEDVDYGKPHPQGYIKAMDSLGVSPADAIVFEDAPAGLAAGRAAGARVIGIASASDGQGADGALWLADFTALSVVVEPDGSLLVTSDASLDRSAGG